MWLTKTSKKCAVPHPDKNTRTHFPKIFREWEKTWGKMSKHTATLELIRTVKCVGGIAIALLVTLNALMLAFIIGAKEMGSSTSDMMALSQDMNASTTKTMARIHHLLTNVTSEDVDAIVGNTMHLSGDLSSMVGEVVASDGGNLTEIVAGVRTIVGSVDTATVTTIVRDAAQILHNARSALLALNVTAAAERVSDTLDGLDPQVVNGIVARTSTIVDTAHDGLVNLNLTAITLQITETLEIVDTETVRAITSDILNVTETARQIVDTLSARHDIKLQF